MDNEIKNGYYLVKPKPKGKLNYMGDLFIVKIHDAKKFPEYCVTLIGDESRYDIKEIKIKKFLDLNRL